MDFERPVDLRPGDSVRVDGAPVTVPFGEKMVFHREATVTHAGLLERTWTRVTGRLEVMELCEFSFSERIAL